VPILWFSHETPDRGGQGGQRRQYFQIESLVRDGHDVRVLTLAGEQDDQSLRGLVPVRRLDLSSGSRRTSLREKAGLTLHLLGHRWSGVVVAHSESWPLGRRIARLAHAPVFVDLHNVHSAWYRAAGDLDRATHYARMEADVLRRADVVAVCSRREAERLSGSDGAVVVVPHGIDEAEWRRGPSERPLPVVKAFGNWAWQPNKDGLAWFLERVWPAVHSRRPDLTCEIAGSAPEWPTLPAGVMMIGRVPSIAEFVHDACAVVVPVVGGVGAPLKYAEALVSGVPVIATSEATHGFEGNGGFVSDEPSEWVDWIADVASNPDAHRVGAATIREAVLRERTWYTQSQPLREWASRLS